MNQKYFDLPFAIAGDQTVIPDPLQVSGAVSFDQGWTFDYQRDLATDPAALPIDRATMNYLFNAITANLKQYQENSIPEFITSANNGGSPFSYGNGVDVMWSASGNAPFLPYKSVIAANTSVPQDGSGNWVLSVGLPTSVIGTSRNAKAYVSAASVSATFTADEVVLETALGGQAIKLSSVNQTFNLTTDMDTGSAPALGFVALYLTYNPLTGATGRLITNAATLQTETYTGAYTPIGYTYSALVAVLPTNATPAFIVSNLKGRRVSIVGNSAALGAAQASFTSVSISAVVPVNARTVKGNLLTQNSTSNTGNATAIASSSTGIGGMSSVGYISSTGGSLEVPISDIDLVTPQTIYYVASTSGGTMTISFNISAYEF